MDWMVFGWVAGELGGTVAARTYLQYQCMCLRLSDPVIDHVSAGEYVSVSECNSGCAYEQAIWIEACVVGKVVGLVHYCKVE